MNIVIFHDSPELIYANKFRARPFAFTRIKAAHKTEVRAQQWSFALLCYRFVSFLSLFCLFVSLAPTNERCTISHYIRTHTRTQLLTTRARTHTHTYTATDAYFSQSRERRNYSNRLCRQQNECGRILCGQIYIDIYKRDGSCSI